MRKHVLSSSVFRKSWIGIDMRFLLPSVPCRMISWRSFLGLPIPTRLSWAHFLGLRPGCADSGGPSHYPTTFFELPSVYSQTVISLDLMQVWSRMVFAGDLRFSLLRKRRSSKRRNSDLRIQKNLINKVLDFSKNVPRSPSLLVPRIINRNLC